jgi:hypothetical protein
VHRGEGEGGLSIKDVAIQLGVPQYRIKAIEAGRLNEDDALVLPRYVSLLGLERWARRWATANPELAATLGLVAKGPGRSKKVPRRLPLDRQRQLARAGCAAGKARR